MTSVDSATEDYVRYLRAKLVDAEIGLHEMNQNYGAAKTRFDQQLAHRGITPDTEMVQYQELKGLHPELDYWYSKVEHYQRQLAAYGAALTGIEAAGRMLDLGVYRRPRPNGKRGPHLAIDAPHSEPKHAAGS